MADRADDRYSDPGFGGCYGPVLSSYGLGIGFGDRAGLYETSFDDVGLGDVQPDQYAQFLDVRLSLAFSLCNRKTGDTK